MLEEEHTWLVAWEKEWTRLSLAMDFREKNYFKNRKLSACNYKLIFCVQTNSLSREGSQFVRKLSKKINIVNVQ